MSQSVHFDKVKNDVPQFIQDFLEFVPTACILGGFVASSLNNSVTLDTDVDIFVHEDDLENALEILEVSTEEQLPYTAGDLTKHVFSGDIGGVSVDLISYSSNFNILLNVDFMCRMGVYTGTKLWFPTPKCLDDILSKKLNPNPQYLSFTKTGIPVTAHDLQIAIKDNGPTSKHSAMCRTVKKYIDRGYSVE